jgi:hypothetical protein
MRPTHRSTQASNFGHDGAIALLEADFLKDQMATREGGVIRSR